MPIVSPHTQPFSERLRPPQLSLCRSKGFDLTLILCVWCEYMHYETISLGELWSDPYSVYTIRPGPHTLHTLNPSESVEDHHSAHYVIPRALP
jgi:hypothetical protein